MPSRVETRGVAHAGIGDVRYNEKVICEIAAKLYMQATAVIIMHSLLGVFIGGFIGGTGGYVLSSLLPHSEQGLVIVAMIGFVATLTGTIGCLIGVQKAFWYKLQAQLALCQVQIEINTRPE